MNYTASGTRNRRYELLDANNNPLGILDYPSMFSRRSAVIEQGGATYEIAAVGFWQTSTEIRRNGTKIATLKFSLRKGLVITMENGPTYVFKRVGFFNSHFGLFTEHEQEIIALKYHFKLAKFSNDYTIETNDNYTEGKNIILLLLMVYCANYMHSMAAAAV